MSHIRTYFAIVFFALIGFNVSYAQSNDTLLLDLASLSSIYNADNQTLTFPVLHLGESTNIHSIDLWFQFNLEKLNYNISLNPQSDLDVYSHYNTNNQFLSSTASTESIESFVQTNSSLWEYQFTMNNPCSELVTADFFELHGLVNGVPCIVVVNNPNIIYDEISIDSSEPHCTNSGINFSYSNQINGQMIDNYNWNFGSTNSTDQNPEISFPFPGIFNPTVELTTEAGCTYLIATEVILIPSPDVEFTWNGTLQNEPITFINSSSISDGVISTYAWDFGDGNSSLETNPEHIYSSASIFSVSLTATSALGCTMTLTEQISISSSNNEFNSSNSLLLYPNPTTNILHLSAQKITSIKIFDCTGRIVPVNIFRLGTNQMDIDTSAMENGIYTIAIASSDVSRTASFIIQK
jgi:PKD repeat protein